MFFFFLWFSNLRFAFYPPFAQRCAKAMVGVGGHVCRDSAIKKKGGNGDGWDALTLGKHKNGVGSRLWGLFFEICCFFFFLSVFTLLILGLCFLGEFFFF